MKTIQANCKFCQNPIELKFYHGLEEKIPSTIKLAACNRCADHYTFRFRVMDRIRRAALNLYGVSLSSPDKYQDAEANARKKLLDLTRSFSRKTSEHYRCNELWDIEFVENILANPRRSDNICLNFHDHIRKQATAETMNI